MHSVEQRLEHCWSGAGDEGLPFHTRVDGEAVLRVLQAELASRHSINAVTDARVRQWMRFDEWVNTHESRAYRREMHRTHARLDAILSRMPTGEDRAGTVRPRILRQNSTTRRLERRCFL